jgi:phosphopantothenoylcysteine decarboxylase
MTAFGILVENESAKLKELWEQWDDLQNEYLEQGVELFGPEKFGEAAELVKGKGKGFKMEMELINGEFTNTIQELKEEIDDLSKTDLQKMKSSEKVRIKPYLMELC